MRNAALRPTMLCAALLIAGMACGRAQAAGAAKAQADLQWVAQFTQQVLAKGHPAQLPPHLSGELALNNGAAMMQVQQIATRVGTTVHAFNVLMDGGRQRVLFSFDEATQSTEAFLLRADGTLDRAVSYRVGEAGSAMPKVAAGAGYRRELRFWREYLYGRSFAPPILTVPLAPPAGTEPGLRPDGAPRAGSPPPDATNRP